MVMRVIFDHSPSPFIALLFGGSHTEMAQHSVGLAVHCHVSEKPIINELYKTCSALRSPVTTDLNVDGMLSVCQIRCSSKNPTLGGLECASHNLVLSRII